jgi:hypothetical protein
MSERGAQAVNRLSLSLGVVAALVGVAASVALANGGFSIASAPELPGGERATGGGKNRSGCCYGEFWRITLARADHLRIDWSKTGGSHEIALCLLDPSVTDSTLSHASCALKDVTNGKHEVTYTVAKSGRWTLEISQDCGSCGQGADMSYELTAYVQRPTHASLSGPRVARAHSLVALSGKIAGLASGKVAIQSRAKTGWKTLTLMRVKANGSFLFKTRVGGTGTYRVRVVFFGDANHLPARAVYSFKVIPATSP